MATLKIRDFSCIEEAEVDLSRLTVLIGPQASGKSIISKLYYFFYSNLLSQRTPLASSTDISDFEADLKKNFSRWFPASAWGSKTFEITFSGGGVELTLTRKKPWRKPSSDFHLTYNEAFSEYFSGVSRKFAELRSAPRPSELETHYSYEMYAFGTAQLAAALENDFVEGQTFVPAGRSFFTSVGKAIAVFDQGNVLDPATLAFGRFWAAVQDRRFYASPVNVAAHHLVESIFGGKLIRERDTQYVKAADGRKIPLTSLSSGQQEILPLWMALQHRFSHPDVPYLMYIEEPEAHLFPQAQSDLIQHLCSLVATRQDRRRLFLTTHSPYVLTKLNNLLKAGELGYRASKERQALISSVVPRNSWILPSQLRAYAIVDGVVRDIIGDDGLIHGDYLDSASSCLSGEFESLLDIEYSTTKRGKVSV